MPFNIAILVLKRATTDLKWSERHSRANLGQLHAVVSSTDKHMMSNLDTVVDILERDDSVAHFVLARDGLPWWKDVLKDLDDSFAQSRCETVKDEVRIRLAHSSADTPRYIVSQNHIV